MRNEYDFSKAIMNPYSKKLKKQITLRIDIDTVDFFKDLAGKTGIPYQKLINLYLSDCAINKKRIQITWK
jgi:predicted DNA binding CopG/RHH family protein